MTKPLFVYASLNQTELQNFYEKQATFVFRVFSPSFFLQMFSAGFEFIPTDLFPPNDAFFPPRTCFDVIKNTSQTISR